MKKGSKLVVSLTALCLTYVLLSHGQAVTASIVSSTESNQIKPEESDPFIVQPKLTKEEIHKRRLEKLRKLATYFEIDTTGKSVDQLRAEINEARRHNPEKWEAFKQELHERKLEKMKRAGEQ